MIREASRVALHKAALLLLLLLSFSLSLFSQKHLFDAELITTEDGLANLLTTSIFKDKQGFIWIGTRYGLNRYDGHTFKLYTKEQNGLYSNENILRISEDSEGNLWLFYKNKFSPNHFGDVPDAEEIKALDIFNPLTGQATPFDVYFDGKAPFKSTAIQLPKVIDPKGRPWISTNNGELFLYDGAFKKIFQREGASFQYISIDSSDNIWVGWENHLLCLNSLGKVLEEIQSPGQVGGIYPGAGSRLWLSTLLDENLKIWRYAKHGGLIPLSLSREGRPWEMNLKKGVFSYRSRKGYWYIEIGRQLNVFDEQGIWLYNYHTLIGESLKTNFSNSFEDERYLWLATPTGALKTSVAENRFQLTHRKEQGFSDCRGIAEGEGGNIYFLNTHLYQWNAKGQACKKLSGTNGAFALTYVDSTLWRGDYTTVSLGFELNLRTNREVRYPVLSPDQHLAYALIKTEKNGQFLAGTNKGLAYIDLNNKQVIPFEQYNGFEILKNSEVNHFLKNSAGIWAATSNGVFLVSEEKGVLRHYSVSSGDLPFGHIRHIHEGPNGVFWLATKGGGIIQWWPALQPNDEGVRLQGYFKQFTTAEGLSNNYTYAIYEDDYGKLWIPSDKGLMWMDTSTFRVRTFLKEDGLPHIEFNHTAHYQAKDGTLYFGGLGGLAAFHPQAFADELANTTPLEFTGYFLLEGDAEKMTDKTELLQESDVIIIRPSDKFFELHFTLLDYDKPERHRYAYQIEGYSNNWNYIDENAIRITNLPYGKYTLRVQGQNSSGGWSEQELSLGIKVLKPFYLQWWFIILTISAISGLALASVRWRITKLKKDRERLEAEVKKRTRQIERDKQTIAAQAESLQELDKAKTRFFSNITHEFRTPLTLIIGPLEQALSEQPPPNIFRRRVKGVLKNAQHLLGLINQLLDLSKIEGRQMKVEAARGDIVAYTRELVKRFQPLAHKKELNLSFLSDQNGWETHFDQDKWDKAVYNLLSNAIKFTPEGGAVQLSVAKALRGQKEFIRLDVKDTGAGIEKDQLEQVFDRFYQIDNSSTRSQGGTGIGLALVKELVELQGGEISISSEVGKGTSFEIHLPVLQAVEPRPLAGGTEEKFLPAPMAVDAAVVPALAAPAGDGSEKLELLIIEDNEEMREYIRYCIDGSKYNITEASNGEEGLEKAQALIPDLIISDVMMPKKDGFAVTQAIRNNISTSHIPLVLLTARASLDSRLEGLRRGADAYLTKPFSPQELALRIENLIEIRRLLQRRYQNGPPPANNEGFQQEDEFIINLRDYILAHIDEADLSGDRVGRHFALSRVHLYRKLKALTGQSISEFVKAVRLEKAMELIREGNGNVSEIAYQTGFSSVSHFSRSFKKQFGKAPSEV